MTQMEALLREIAEVLERHDASLKYDGHQKIIFLKKGERTAVIELDQFTLGIISPETLNRIVINEGMEHSQLSLKQIAPNI